MLHARHRKLATTCRRSVSRLLASSTREQADAANGEKRQNQRNQGRRAQEEWKRPHAAGGMGRVASPQEAGCQGLPCAPAAAIAHSTYVRHCGANCTARDPCPSTQRKGAPGQTCHPCRKTRAATLRTSPRARLSARCLPRSEVYNEDSRAPCSPSLLGSVPRFFLSFVKEEREQGQGSDLRPKAADGIGPALG